MQPVITSADKEPDYYRALYQVAKSISSSLSHQHVLDLIVESAAKAMGAKACSLRLLDESRERLDVGATYGLSREYIGKGPVEVKLSPIDAEVLDNRVVRLRDAPYDPRVQYPREVAAEGIVSMLIVPIMVRDFVIGVMRVYTDQAHDFGEDEVEFLRAVASLGGLAIENARVYETLQAQFESIRRERIPWAENFRKPAWR
jgi:signal transduction protein with GAF and PtsI domain